MNKNDLKSMWRDAHYWNSDINFSKVSIEEAMSLKHSKVISKTLLDVKLKVLLYILMFIIYIGLMIYAFLYLKLNLSINSLVPLVLVGIFLLITATSEFVRLLVLIKTADNFISKRFFVVFLQEIEKNKDN